MRVNKVREYYRKSLQEAYNDFEENSVKLYSCCAQLVKDPQCVILEKVQLLQSIIQPLHHSSEERNNMPFSMFISPKRIKNSAPNACIFHHILHLFELAMREAIEDEEINTLWEILEALRPVPIQPKEEIYFLFSKLYIQLGGYHAKNTEQSRFLEKQVKPILIAWLREGIECTLFTTPPLTTSAILTHISNHPSLTMEEKYILLKTGYKFTVHNKPLLTQFLMSFLIGMLKENISSFTLKAFQSSLTELTLTTYERYAFVSQLYSEIREEKKTPPKQLVNILRTTFTQYFIECLESAIAQPEKLANALDHLREVKFFTADEKCLLLINHLSFIKVDDFLPKNIAKFNPIETKERLKKLLLDETFRTLEFENSYFSLCWQLLQDGASQTYLEDLIKIIPLRKKSHEEIIAHIDLNYPMEPLISGNKLPSLDYANVRYSTQAIHRYKEWLEKKELFEKFFLFKLGNCDNNKKIGHTLAFLP